MHVLQLIVCLSMHVLRLLLMPLIEEEEEEAYKLRPANKKLVVDHAFSHEDHDGHSDKKTAVHGMSASNRCEAVQYCQHQA